jgi:hypothetical protein
MQSQKYSMTTLPADVTDEWVYIFMKELDLIKQNITQKSDNVNEFEREITPLMIIKGDYSVNENKRRLLC